ncbi:MAG: tripartite tricarboxylate transporter substrate binding protein BugD [Xanthobacteraceae bacterium]|nr:tripartite tricarboxylate transporter substrate binding protein BugD [Xanthobacteraceae bacterium]
MKCLSLALAIALAGIAAAQAQTYPSRPITLVVPFPPGGSTDVIARITAERMRASLGQPIVIENVGAAQGSVGVGRVARAAADGYTIDIGQWDTHVVNGAIYSLPYDLVTDFEPIALLSKNPLLIVGRKSLPPGDLAGLIAWLKANPDKATQGNPTAGGHVAGAYFQKETGTRFTFVPYRGAGPAMQDLVSGQIDLLIVQPAVALPQVRTGAIKAFASTGNTRLAVASDIATVAEAGLPSLEMMGWYGLFAPKGTPKEIIAKLAAAVNEALSDPGVRQRLADLGQEIPEPAGRSPAALRELQKAEIEKWWPIIKAANIRGE